MPGRNPFSIAHQAHAAGAVIPQPAMPQMASGLMSAPQPEHGFHALAKQFGLSGMKLDKNPVVARTQLMQHLHNRLGPGYMSHPGVQQLLESFNGGAGKAALMNEPTNVANNAKALMGK